jgi:hypothetical protein
MSATGGGRGKAFADKSSPALGYTLSIVASGKGAGVVDWSGNAIAPVWFNGTKSADPADGKVLTDGILSPESNVTGRGALDFGDGGRDKLYRVVR